MPSPPSALHHVRILLIQARNTAEMERQEKQCFIERTGVETDRLFGINVVREPLRVDVLDAVDVVMIGGAGEYSAFQNPAWMDPLLQFVRLLRDRKKPTFGSCWGHQVIARALGGTVVRDPDNAELGCGTVQLTDAGRRDPLFQGFPDTFNANMGHHDRVVELPDGAVELARNDQPNQAYRLKDAPIYGTQFHSELDADRERERLVAYREYYRDDMPSDEDFRKVIENLATTTDVDHLLKDFLRIYVLGERNAPDEPVADSAPSPSTDASDQPS